jgi:RNA polymerase sigma factor (sigma-70 family)
MSLLPTRTTYNQSASSVISQLKKAGQQQQNDFIWANQDRFYAIALLATDRTDIAENMTATAFRDVFAAIRQVNTKQIGLPLWEWLAPFIVRVCADYHHQNSRPVPIADLTEATEDGSAQMDWETTVILGLQRVKRCFSTLPPEQRKIFILRHQLSLDYAQIACVLNQNVDIIMSWLYRARVQIVKCLGRG